MAPMEDGFRGQPKRNKQQTNIEEQNKIKLAENALKRDAINAAKPATTTQPTTTTTRPV